MELPKEFSGGTLGAAAQVVKCDCLESGVAPNDLFHLFWNCFPVGWQKILFNIRKLPQFFFSSHGF